MILIPRSCIALLLLGIALSPAFSEEKDEKLTADQLPAAVKATMVKEAAGAALSDYEKETKKGKVVYTAEMPGAKKGEVIELTVAEDGTLVSKEAEHDDGDEKGGKDEDEKGEHEGHHEK